MKRKLIKLVFILICVFFNINKIYGLENKNITDNAIIKYKWYKEEITDGRYYPKKDKLEGYLEDPFKVQYGNYSIWNSEYCSYPKENYLIESKERYIYNRVLSAKYIKLENINISDIKDIKIYSKNKLLEHEIIESKEDMIKISLNTLYQVDTLWFYIDTDKEYDISLSFYEDYIFLSLKKHIKEAKILIPDKTWITDETYYVDFSTEIKEEKTDFIKVSRINILCRVREIQTYRYKINRVYYDDNYYEYIEGYIPDKEQYIIEYTGELPKEIITITNTETIEKNNIQKEYVYINNDKEDDKEKENISIQECNTSINDTANTNSNIEYIEKEVIKEINKIPTKLYILLGLLIFVIIIQFIKIIKKKVVRNI